MMDNGTTHRECEYRLFRDKIKFMSQSTKRIKDVASINDDNFKIKYIMGEDMSHVLDYSKYYYLAHNRTKYQPPQAKLSYPKEVPEDLSCTLDQ
jgi:hypothetical protein